MPNSKLYATLTRDPVLTTDFLSDLELVPMQRIYLREINLWGRINYFFHSREDKSSWIIRIKTDDGQLSKHIRVRPAIRKPPALPGIS